jgi:hypothetical protein
MKFTLTSQDENYFFQSATQPQATTRTVSFSSEYLHDIVAEFELFLRGSGFEFDGIEVFEEGGEAEDFEEVASGDLFKDESKDEPQLPDYFGISARMKANNKS